MLFRNSDDGYTYQKNLDIDDFENPTNIERSWVTSPDERVDPSHTYDELGNPSTDIGSGPYLLRWQTSPVMHRSDVNVNLFQEEHSKKDAELCLETESAVLGGFAYAEHGDTSSEDPLTAFYATLLSIEAREPVTYEGDPISFLAIPVFDSWNQHQERQSLCCNLSFIAYLLARYLTQPCEWCNGCVAKFMWW